MEKIGIFYGPTKSRTANIAEKIYNQFDAELVDIYPIDTTTIDQIIKYKNLIFGVSSLGSEVWDGKSAGNQWGAILPKIKDTDFTGKKIALFGLGDHITYAAKFVDAIGDMAQILRSRNAEIIGHVSADDYTFTESKALVDGKFIGLPIDEDYESEKSDMRIENWVEVLKKTFI